MDHIRQHMTAFATAIAAKVRALRATAATSAQQQRLRESISDDIKKATNFHPHHQSVAAQDFASSSGIDLTGKTWHDQHHFDPKRRIFVVEHKRTVGSIRELCIQAEAEDRILEILTKEICAVWVLREEDDRLTRLGFRVRRPDPDDAYRQAGIEIAKQ